MLDCKWQSCMLLILLRKNQSVCWATVKGKWRGSLGVFDHWFSCKCNSILNTVSLQVLLNSTKLIIQGNSLYGRDKVIRYGSTYRVILWLEKLWGSICYQILSPSSLFCWREFFGHQEIRVGRYFVHCIELKKTKYFSILKDIFSDFFMNLPLIFYCNSVK